MRAEAVRDLLAPREDVWRFATDPFRIPDWWPGVSGVSPDRRGLAEGARWHVQGRASPGLVRRPNAEGLLLVRRVDRPSLFAFHLTSERLDVELRLEPSAARRTRVLLALHGPLLAARRSLATHALRRLYDLCQTGAEP